MFVIGCAVCGLGWFVAIFLFCVVIFRCLVGLAYCAVCWNDCCVGAFLICSLMLGFINSVGFSSSLWYCVFVSCRCG